MELWMWIIAVAMAIGGFMWGFFFARSSDNEASATKERAKALEAEVGTLKTDLNSYRDQVTGHFRTTAELVHQMTQSYKAVYEHLASGSQKLCSGEVMLELDEAPRLATSTSSATPAASDTTESHKPKATAAQPDAPATFH